MLHPSYTDLMKVVNQDVDVYKRQIVLLKLRNAGME